MAISREILSTTTRS